MLVKRGNWIWSWHKEGYYFPVYPRYAPGLRADKNFHVYGGDPVSAILGIMGLGYSVYSGQKSAGLQEKSAAQGLLEQQSYNQQQLDLQNKQLMQNRQQMDMNAWGGADMLSGGETSTLAPTSGGSSSIYGTTDNNMNIIPGASQILGQQPNVYQWF
jgi:hypothetical protein